jgi:formylglycine-generating enzyme required for sulfatase activity
MPSTQSRITLLVALTLACTGFAQAQIGTNYCTANPNSTGATGVMSASGSTNVLVNDLTLACSNLPPSSLGYFLVSRTQGFIANPAGSAGNLCLGAPIGRYSSAVQAASAAGTVSMRADLAHVPNSTSTTAVVPGETLNFQYWHRDSATGGGATSNFGDGLEVLFTLVPGMPNLVWIPAGTFDMGSNACFCAPDWSFPHERPVHQVTISRPFGMGAYEVTQAEYTALMGWNPSQNIGASLPVDSVTWHQARAYCVALTAQQAAAGQLPAGHEYRLPTEAEWEYACRAGSTTEFHYGANLFCGQENIEFSTHSNTSCGATGSTPVGSYSMNLFGLYDMHGNLLEWCLDSYSAYTAAPVTDPFVSGGPHRVIRGGCYFSESGHSRSAFRGYNAPTSTQIAFGFRVVLGQVLAP